MQADVTLILEEPLCAIIRYKYSDCQDVLSAGESAKDLLLGHLGRVEYCNLELSQDDRRVVSFPFPGTGLLKAGLYLTAILPSKALYDLIH
jgi:hypothetical protein